jgi:Outer membrane protein beta-barrel domain
MKKILILVIGLLSSVEMMAQRDFILSHIDRRGFLNISGGWSMPIGSPYKSDPDAPSDLMALSGSSFQVSMGYRLNHRWGAVLNFTNCLNDGSTNQMIQKVENGKLGSNWKASSGTWNCSHLLIGPYATFTFNRLMVDGRLTGGMSFVERPGTELKGDYYGNLMSVRTKSVNTKSFTAGLGASVRYKIGRNIALAIHADYLTTRSTFGSVETTINIGTDTGTEFLREVKPIGILSLNGGLSLLF